MMAGDWMAVDGAGWRDDTDRRINNILGIGKLALPRMSDEEVFQRVYSALVQARDPKYRVEPAPDLPVIDLEEALDPEYLLEWECSV
jgi:hypothetical protein